MSYRVTSIINSARVCPIELPVLSTQHVCVLPSNKYYQISTGVSYRVNSVLSTQHGCVILDPSPPASNTLIISPSLGQEIGPSLGQEIGPSLGQEISPALVRRLALLWVRRLALPWVKRLARLWVKRFHCSRSGESTSTGSRNSNCSGSRG